MASPNHFNSLAAYVHQGGHVWLLGGGIARASLEPWDHSSPAVYSFDEGTLAPGRMLYDQAHLRSSISLSTAGHPVKSSRAVGPDYGALPAELRLRSAQTGDPLPPLRESQPSLFYPTSSGNEYVSLPNAILEGAVSVLDTLYESSGTGGAGVPAGAVRPMMTLYHGNENVPVLYSGHDLWSFARTDLQQLVDAVLQGVWGLQHEVATGPKPSPRQSITAAATRTTVGRAGARH
jgi:hypothetical protein